MAMTGIVDDDAALVARLREHDEAAFAALVDHYAPAMLRVARGYVSNVQTAEDVVQETWIAVMNGIAGFEARSSLRTWLFTVLINIAKKRGVRDRRIAESERMAAGVTVDPDRFRPADGAGLAGSLEGRAGTLPLPRHPGGIGART